MYANGRAKGPGRWTRAGLSVGRPKGVKPLPFHLQVLPMPMSRTPVHPDCSTEQRQWGDQAAMERWDTRAFHAGRTLKRTHGAWRITLGARSFYCDDALHAMAWVRAANHYRHRLGAVLTKETQPS